VKRRPNVLLVVLDALRRDAIEPYGAPAGSTPALAELARRGAALPYAYATSSWTLPSHASMFGGRLPRALALGQPPDGSPQGARPVVEALADRLLPGVLRSAGYETLGFSANLWASPHVGFDAGFDRFEYAVPDRGGRIESMLSDGLRATAAWALEGARARSDNGAAQIGASLLDAIDTWSGRPTFWFANLCECHSPCLPPRPWNDLTAVDRTRAAIEARRYLSFEALCLYAAGHSSVPPPALQRMRHLYGRAAAYMDRWIGDLLEALERRGILEETLVIVTADHGENFGEHGYFGHGFAVNEALIHVPLVIAGPGAPGPGGVFSLASLPRTVADAAGIDRHPWPADELPAGLAVSQYDAMGPPDDPRVIAFAQRWGLDDDAVARLTASFTAVTDGRRKLVRRNREEPLLYDLERDPDERSPLAARQTDGRFADLLAALEHPAVADASTPAASAARPDEPSPAELEQLQQQLRLLGYM
jgi:arylsulfatase A-like enzyme